MKLKIFLYSFIYKSLKTIINISIKCIYVITTKKMIYNLYFMIILQMFISLYIYKSLKTIIKKLNITDYKYILFLNSTV